MSRMSFVDFNELRDVGVFRDDVEYDRGMLITPDGEQIRANFDDPAAARRTSRSAASASACATACSSTRASSSDRKAFYAGLRELPAEQRRLFAMRGISFVNELYGHEWELKCAQRRHARFVNTTMMVTGLGAAVSDALEDGRVVSGVGGQYNFVAMAHALPEARSILCLRATRTARGATSLEHRCGTTATRPSRGTCATSSSPSTASPICAAAPTARSSRRSCTSWTRAFRRTSSRAAQRARKLPRDYRIPDAARGRTIHAGSARAVRALARARPVRGAAVRQRLHPRGGRPRQGPARAGARRPGSSLGTRADALGAGRCCRGAADARRMQPYLARMSLRAAGLSSASGCNGACWSRRCRTGSERRQRRRVGDTLYFGPRPAATFSRAPHPNRTVLSPTDHPMNA